MSMAARKPLLPDVQGPAQAEPEDSALCPIEAVRDMRELAVRMADVHCLVTKQLDRLLTQLEEDTVKAFDGTPQDQVYATAVALGRSHWARWADVVERAQIAMTEAELPYHASSDFTAKWEHRAECAERCLPHLSDSARLLYRATAFVMLESSRGDTGRRAAEARAQDPRWPWSTPVEKVSENILALHALSQAMYVAGRTDWLGSDCAEALARTLWNVVTRNLDADRAESAFIAALDVESRLANASGQLDIAAANDASLEEMFAAERSEDERRTRLRTDDLSDPSYYTE